MPITHAHQWRDHRRVVGAAQGTRQLAVVERERMPALALVRHRHRRQQPPCVGMMGIVQHRLARPNLYDLPEIHDGDAVRHALDHCHVVGDKLIGDTEPRLQRHQQVHHLRADRVFHSGVQRGHVSGCDRLASGAAGFR